MLKDKDIREPLFDFLQENSDYRGKNDGKIQSGRCDGFGRRTGRN
jgi:hypothetical protein